MHVWAPALRSNLSLFLLQAKSKWHFIKAENVHLCPLASSFMLSCSYFSHQTFWHSVDAHVTARSLYWNTSQPQWKWGRRLHVIHHRHPLYRPVKSGAKYLSDTVQQHPKLLHWLFSLRYHIILWKFLYPVGGTLNLASSCTSPSAKCLLGCDCIHLFQRMQSAEAQQLVIMFIRWHLFTSFTAVFLCKMDYITFLRTVCSWWFICVSSS